MGKSIKDRLSTIEHGIIFLIERQSQLGQFEFLSLAGQSVSRSAWNVSFSYNCLFGVVAFLSLGIAFRALGESDSSGPLIAISWSCFSGAIIFFGLSLWTSISGMREANKIRDEINKLKRLTILMDKSTEEFVKQFKHDIGTGELQI